MIRTKRNTVLVLCLNSNAEIDEHLNVFASDFEGLTYVSYDGRKPPSGLEKLNILTMQSTQSVEGIIEALKKHVRQFTNGSEDIQINVCGTMGALEVSVYCIAIKSMLPTAEVIMYEQSCPDINAPTAKAGFVVCKSMGVKLENLYPIGAF